MVAVKHPNAFISYSHDSPEHKKWVLKLATDLRGVGIDVTLDQWDLQLGEDVVQFMQSGITQSDRVILICSEAYVKKSDRGQGGVGYEKLIVSAEVAQKIDTAKFIPVIRSQDAETAAIPKFLGARRYADFRDDVTYADTLKELAHEIHGLSGASKPPLGTNPFSGQLQSTGAPMRVTGPTGVTASGQSILNEPWFQSHHHLSGNRFYW